MGRVKVEALQYHTTAGEEYHPGDRYDIEPELVDTVVVQGKAKVVEPGAAKAAKPAAKSRAKASRPVEPMTTKNSGLVRRTRGKIVGGAKKK